ncbi:hypothetical protein WICPIJ_004716, partial [Wickerhamomyces pijperi]
WAESFSQASIDWSNVESKSWKSLHIPRISSLAAKLTTVSWLSDPEYPEQAIALIFRPESTKATLTLFRIFFRV